MDLFIKICKQIDNSRCNRDPTTHKDRIFQGPLRLQFLPVMSHGTPVHAFLQARCRTPIKDSRPALLLALIKMAPLAHDTLSHDGPKSTFPNGVVREKHMPAGLEKVIPNPGVHPYRVLNTISHIQSL